MNQFTRKVLGKDNIPETDIGVQFSELISILEISDISKQLLELLDAKSYENDFIQIPGAATLISTQKKINKKYWKEDLESSIDDIDLYKNNIFTINFNSVNTNSYFKDLKIKQITTEPIYSATREFFSSLFHMDKYASSLINKGHKEIINTNLTLLKAVQKPNHKYRILHDKEENKFFLRAIISRNKYYDYNNNVAIVVGLLILHNEMKKTGINYNLYRCEYNESFIRMFFKSSEIKQLGKIGHVTNIIQISNDEIKREALRFTGVCTINFKDSKDNDSELFILPKDIKSKILSIKHNQSPKTAIKELSNISSSKEVHQKLYNDISKIMKINKPEQIKYLVKKKIEKAKSEEVKRFKHEYLEELKIEANNIIQLLTIFKKLELLAGEDIDAAEYIRYLIYTALIEKK